MKNHLSTKAIAGLGIAVATGLSLCVPGAVRPVEASSHSTGQGIMVDVKTSSSYAIHETQQYRYNEETAAGYFTNLWDGAAPVVASSNGNCAAPLGFPAAPAPDPNKLRQAIKANQCLFLDGGVLTGASYTQSVPVTVSCQVLVNKKLQTRSTTYTYTYTYNVSPVVPAVVAFTAWDLVGTSGDGLSHVAVNADIAGESVLAKSGGWRKYSFSMRDQAILDEFGVTVGYTTRVSDLKVWLNYHDQDGTITGSSLVGLPGTTLVEGEDFAYATNAGTNNNATLLQDGDARTILNTDSHAGNDNGGSDGSALALARMDTVGLDLGPGAYSVTVTGTVKGNSGTSPDQGFSITKHVHIVAPGCSGNGN